MPFPVRKFRKAREATGLSRAEFATRHGIEPRTLESIEQGRRTNPTQDLIEKLCAALGVTCEFFFGEDLPEDGDKPGRGRPTAPEPAPHPSKGKKGRK